MHRISGGDLMIQKGIEPSKPILQRGSHMLGLTKRTTKKKQTFVTTISSYHSIRFGCVIIMPTCLCSNAAGSSH
jgi:hypothetical protein